MAKTEAKTLEAPDDETLPDGSQKKRRYRILGEGEGDYCIYQIVGAGQKMPEGTLLPIPETPRFEHTQEAKRWIKAESGDLCAGKQLAIIRFCSILNAEVQMRAVVTITEKPPILVRDTDPAAEPAKA